MPVRRQLPTADGLLTRLIEDFEEKRCQLPRSKPLDVPRFLMEQHNLLPEGSGRDIWNARIGSEVSNGQRELKKKHIKRLAARFQVLPELFF
jgi:antitoxin component HigA of HigAB toxin-antitoxin module